MNRAELLKRVHKRLRLDDLQMMTKELYQEFQIDTCPYEEWCEEVERNGYEIGRFYLDIRRVTWNVCFYVGEYYTAALPVATRDWLGQDITIGQCQKSDEQYKGLLESGRYGLFFFPEGNPFVVDYFIKYVDSLPESEVFEVFEMVYTLMDDGFSLFPKEVVDRVMKLAPRDNIKGYVTEHGRQENGRVRVYRGEHRYSTPHDKTMSWTLSKVVAGEFANRFEQGTILTGYVNIEDILHGVNDRNEKEVWVYPEAVKDVEVLSE